MTEFIANESNIEEVGQKIADSMVEIIAGGGVAKITVVKKATRTTSMNALWRGKWMEETAQWMNNQGVKIEIKNSKGAIIHTRAVTADDAHEMFVMHWLGSDDEGSRELTRDMQKSRMLFLMDRHSHWAVEKGLLLTYPSDSEFNKLMEQQNGIS